jgi:hypothetical protein
MEILGVYIGRVFSHLLLICSVGCCSLKLMAFILCYVSSCGRVTS